jgi:hypothetical protein
MKGYSLNDAEPSQVDKACRLGISGCAVNFIALFDQ